MENNNLKEVPIEELQAEVIEEFPNVPNYDDIPLPEEPSVEEQIRMATQELEQKNSDLTQKIYYMERENEELRKAIQEQETTFNKVIAGLCITMFSER